MVWLPNLSSGEASDGFLRFVVVGWLEVGRYDTSLLKKKIEHLIYGDHNYGARRAPRPPEGNHWHPEG